LFEVGPRVPKLSEMVQAYEAKFERGRVLESSEQERIVLDTPTKRYVYFAHKPF
jgi:hypothetical protein